jgi:hypothetical protein
MRYLTKRQIRERKKKRCLHEYAQETLEGYFRTVTFYAESWEVSRSTAHNWMQEFELQLMQEQAYKDVRYELY